MKPFGGLIGDRQAVQGLSLSGFQTPPEPEKEGVITVDDLTPGMVIDLPREKIPLGSFRKIRNGRVRGGDVGRRPGTQEFITKPDSNPVLKVVTFMNEGGDPWLLRLTSSSAHGTMVLGGWTPFTHDLSGRELRVALAQYAGYLFLQNADEQLRAIDFGARKIYKVEGAPLGKFITNFADRIVVANLRTPIGGPAPFGIQWSENDNPFSFAGLSAGGVDLPQGGRGQGNEITGVFGLSNVMAVLRRGSIWLAERQAFASNPLRFFQAVPEIGCDLPYTADTTEHGVVFADQRTQGVYVFQPGAQPQLLSGPIRSELLQDLQNLMWAEGAYDPFEQEYHLGLSTVPGDKWPRKFWVFSFRTGAWSYDDSPRISTIGAVSVPTATVTIDQLVGSIDAQVGTIDSFASDLIHPQLFKGTPTGEVLKQTFDADTDFGGAAFEFELISQNLGNPSQERVIKEVMLKALASKPGSALISLSKDGVTWKHEKNVALVASGDRQSVRLPQQITGNDLYFRLRSSQSDVRIGSYWFRSMDGSEQV